MTDKGSHLQTRSPSMCVQRWAEWVGQQSRAGLSSPPARWHPSLSHKTPRHGAKWRNRTKSSNCRVSIHKAAEKIGALIVRYHVFGMTLKYNVKCLTMTSTFPTHSKEKSTPPSVISASTWLMGLSWSLGFTNSVAPNTLALSNLSGLMSTAIILLAPAFLQPMTAAKPTAPRPNTAHVEPGST